MPVTTARHPSPSRVLQAKAHEQLGQLLPREKHKQAYDESLKQRYKHLPDVKRILRHRHLPATIYKARCLTMSLNLRSCCADENTACLRLLRCA